MQLLRKNMFLITLAFGLMAYLFIQYRQMGINRTIGYLFNDKDLASLLLLCSCAVFTLGFAVLRVFRTAPNEVASICNLVLLVAALLVNEFWDSIISVLITLSNLVVFLINMGVSIKLKVRQPKSSL